MMQIWNSHDLSKQNHSNRRTETAEFQLDSRANEDSPIPLDELQYPSKKLKSHKDKRKALRLHNSSKNSSSIAPINNSYQTNQKRSSSEQQLQQEQISQNHRQNDQRIKMMRRFRPYFSMYFLDCFLLVTLWTPALYMIFLPTNYMKLEFNQLHYYFQIVCFIFLNIYIVWDSGRHGLKELFFMHFHLDNLMLVTVVSSISFLTLLSFSTQGDYNGYLNMVSIPVVYFLGTANIRLSVKWVILTVAQIIFLKICIFTQAIIFFSLGAYFMIVDFKVTKGLDPPLDDKFKDFFLLFVFSNFALFAQIFSLLNSRDQTEDLKYTYQLIDGKDEEQYMKQKLEKGQVKINPNSHNLTEEYFLKMQNTEEDQVTNADELYIKNKDGGGFQKLIPYRYNPTSGLISYKSELKRSQQKYLIEFKRIKSNKKKPMFQ